MKNFMIPKFNKLILITSIVALSSAFYGYQYGLHRAYSESSLQTTPTIDKTKPILTVAGIVYVETEQKYALIQRGKEPKGLAMFGGHVEAKESPEEAFVREAKEELNVDVKDLKLIGLHGVFGRDPRQHSVEGTYFCTTSQLPYAGSNAKSVILYSSDELMNLVGDHGQKFAFDHREILKNFFKEKSNDALQR